MEKYELKEGKLFLKEVDDVVFDWSAVRESIISGLDSEIAKAKMTSHALAMGYGINTGFQRETSEPKILLYDSQGVTSKNPESLVEATEKEPISKKEFLDEFYQKLAGSGFVVVYGEKEFSIREGAKIKTTIKISEANTKDGYWLDISRVADDQRADYVGFVSFDDSKRLEELVKN